MTFADHDPSPCWVYMRKLALEPGAVDQYLDSGPVVWPVDRENVRPLGDDWVETCDA